MISHRLRAVVAGIPIAVLSTVLFASPVFAASSLSISTPLAGTTVSGELLVEGRVAGGTGVDVSLGLAPQALGDCGSPVALSTTEAASADFAVSLSTTSVPDGTYCLIAVADAGRLSTVVADITVNNAFVEGESLDELQLPTEALDDPSSPAVSSPIVAASPVGDLSVLGPIVLVATALLAMLVLGLGVWALRRTAR